MWLCRARRTGLRPRFVAQHRLDGHPRDAQDLRVICHDNQPHAGHRPLATTSTSEAFRIHRREDVRSVWGPEAPPRSFREQNFSCAYACRPNASRRRRRTNVWREVTSPARGQKLQRSGDGSATQFLWPPVAGVSAAGLLRQAGGMRPCPMELLAVPTVRPLYVCCSGRAPPVMRRCACGASSPS